MSTTERHLVNQRTNGGACCADKATSGQRDYAKKP